MQTAVWIVEHELWLLLMVTPLLLFPSQLTPFGLVLVLLPWPCRWVAKNHLVARTPLEWPILGLLLMAIVSLYPSIDLYTSAVILCQIVAGVSLFYGVVNWAWSDERIWLATALPPLIGLILAIVAPSVTRWEANKLFAWPELYQSFTLLWPEEAVNPNVLAGALILLLPLVVALLSSNLSPLTQGEKRLARLLLALTLIVMLAAVALTQSRGAYLALAIGLVIFGCLRCRWFLSAIPILFLEVIALLRRFSIQPMADFVLNNATLGGVAGRLEIWSGAVYMLRDFPYTGIGLGTFGRMAYARPYFTLSRPDATVSHAHNLFLQIGVDLGLPGLLAYIVLLVTASNAAWQAYRTFGRSGRSDLAALAAGLLASIVVLVVHGLTDAVTWGTKPAIIPWLIMGLAAALHHRAREGTRPYARAFFGTDEHTYGRLL